MEKQPRTALVTGAASGIGQAIAMGFVMALTLRPPPDAGAPPAAEDVNP